MKTFRLVPFLLAGFCGYLHTVIKNQFHMGADVISNQLQLQRHMIDMPNKLRDSSSPSSSSQIRSSTPQQPPTQPSLPVSSNDVSVSLLQPRNIKTTMNEFVKDVPQYIEGQETAAKANYIVPPDEEHRVPVVSEEYQTAMLQYTMDLLPHHMNGGNSNNKDSADIDEEDVKNPKPYQYRQIDVMVPASGPQNDAKLRRFAQHLGVALKHFQEWYQTERRPAVLRTLKQRQETNEEQDITLGMVEQENNLDLTVRFLVTRYAQDAQKTKQDIQQFQQELAELTGLPLDQIVLVRVGHHEDEVDSKKKKRNKNKKKLKRRLEEEEKDNAVRDDNDEHADEDDNEDENEDEHADQENEDDSDNVHEHDDTSKVVQFQRGHARNALHEHACGDQTCVVTSMDVDMQVLPIFFHHALKAAEPHIRAYFPIVFSEYNPATVQLVQDYLYPPATDNAEEEQTPELLPPFSKHRGLWRDFGFGMYVLSGPDVKRFRFNEQYQGWGHEDNDFYNLVRNSIRVDRQHEHGLVHRWHPKDCSVGKDIITEQQWVDCLNSRDAMEGSALGMLLRPPLPARSKEGFEGAKKQYEKEQKRAADAETRLTAKTKKRKKRETARIGEDEQNQPPPSNEDAKEDDANDGEDKQPPPSDEEANEDDANADGDKRKKQTTDESPTSKKAHPISFEQKYKTHKAKNLHLKTHKAGHLGTTREESGVAAIV